MHYLSLSLYYVVASDIKDSIPINVILLMSADTVGASAIKDYIPINVILLMKGACDAGGCIAFSDTQ